MFLTRVSIILSTLCIIASGKIYKRCELARELRNFDVSEDEIDKWVCIAQHESNFDTAAMNPGSGDHGLFQISQLFWCSPPGEGYGCNSPCSKFRDDDIADDLQCIRRIYNEHKRISGDGFNAWVVYPLHCNGDTSRYTLGCFDEEPTVSPDISSNVTDNEIFTEDVDEFGDGYNFPALPSFPNKHKDEKVDYGDGYEFPKLPYSKSSIHDFVSAKNTSSDSPPPLRDSKILPFSRISIHDAVKVGEKKNHFPKFPYSKTSIHHYIPTHGKKFEFPKFPPSKESIHDFVPVSFEEDSILKHTTEAISDDITSNSPPSSKIATVQYSTAKSITIKPTKIHKSFVSSQKPKTTSRKLSTSTSKSHSVSTQFRTTTESPFTTTKTPITSLETSNIQYPSKTTNKPFTTSKTTSKKFVSISKGLENQLHTTKQEPLTTLESTTKYSTTFRSYTTTPKSFITSPTTKRLHYTDLEGASSTFIPVSAIYNPFTTTLKPLATFKPFTQFKSITETYKSPSTTIKPLVVLKPFTTTTTKLYVSSRFDQYKTTTSTKTNSLFTIKSFNVTTTKKPAQLNQQTPLGRARPLTTAKPTTTYFFKPFITPTTTLKPLGRQVTFAPDSFFSWLFNSQTLPPLVPPARPPRPGINAGRPTTIRPLVDGRPQISPGRPPRPLGVPAQGGGEQPDLSFVTTRRPFPRPNMPRPPRPQQRPFAASGERPRPTHRGPFRPGLGSDSSFYAKDDSTEASTSVYKDEKNSTNVTWTPSVGRSDGFMNIEEDAVEVKLDDHFVFVRTKYGYRLFRH